jgi:hypothetical protein
MNLASMIVCRRCTSTVVLAVLAAACSLGRDSGGRSTSHAQTPPLDAGRLEALARYDFPLADSARACVLLDSTGARAPESAVTAAIHPNDRYRCEMGGGIEFTVALLVDTTDDEFQVITGLRISGDGPDAGDLGAMTAEPPPRGYPFIATQDFDGDGLRELKLLSFWGATGNVGWNIWRRDTASARFIPDPDLMAMINPQPLRDAPCVRTWGGGGMAARIYTATVHCNDTGQWIQRWYEHQEWDDANRFFLRTLRVRLPGQDSLVFLRTDTVRDTL